LQTRKQAFGQLGILNNFGAVERRTQRSGMGVFAAQSATNTTLYHGGYWVYLQGIGIVFERQGGAARQPDASMIAIAHIFVDAIFDAQSALASGLQLSQPRLDAPLPF
jgi:hypothetical protein